MQGVLGADGMEAMDRLLLYPVWLVNALRRSNRHVSVSGLFLLLLPLIAIQIFGFFYIPFAAAQSVKLISPDQPAKFAEGDDFASTVLANPWDFDERRDIGWEEGFVGQSIAADGGVWTAKSSRQGAYVFPLFPGFLNTVLAEGIPGDRSLPRFGLNHPINASKYRLLSYRLNVSERTAYAIYWNPVGGTASGWPDGSYFRANSDGFAHGGASFMHRGFTLYQHDLATTKFEQSRGNWSGAVGALRLDPSTGAAPGSRFDFDWVRLVDPASGRPITVRWQTSAVPTAHPRPIVAVYYDTNSSGYNGTPIAYFSTQSDPGIVTLNSAIFPPGVYRFYVEVITPQRAILARSQYSAPIEINHRPSGYFLHPSPVSGEDYASSIGNPWDMSDASDVPNLSDKWPDQWRRFVSPRFISGQFEATAVAVGASTSDAQVHLNVSPNALIDTNKYRYLTYRMAIDATQYPTISEKIQKGWVARSAFWGPAQYSPVGSTKAHIVYEGGGTYTYDLWSPQNFEPGQRFQDRAYQHFLRIDPVETSFPTKFWLDFAMLTAEPRSQIEGKEEVFDLHFVIEDKDTHTLKVSIGIDTDNLGFDGIIVQHWSAVGPGSHMFRYRFPAQGAERRLYPYLLIDDGRSRQQVYSAVPFVVGPKAAAIAPTVTPVATPAQNNVQPEALIGPPQFRVSSRSRIASVRAAVSHTRGVRQVYLSVQRAGTRAKRVNMKRLRGSMYEGRWNFPRSKRAITYTVKLAVVDSSGRRTVKNLGTIRAR